LDQHIETRKMKVITNP